MRQPCTCKGGSKAALYHLRRKEWFLHEIITSFRTIGNYQRFIGNASCSHSLSLRSTVRSSVRFYQDSFAFLTHFVSDRGYNEGESRLLRRKEYCRERKINNCALVFLDRSAKRMRTHARPLHFGVIPCKIHADNHSYRHDEKPLNGSSPWIFH